MIQLSLIYVGFTVLLAIVDAIRIKIVWGKKANIDHNISFHLAVLFTAVAIALYSIPLGLHLHMGPIKLAVVINAFGWPACGLIRLSEYPVALNFFRILTKTNPTGRIDYKSVSTSSSVDRLRWWNKLSFWQQRAVATTGWAVLIFLWYKLIE